MQIATSTNLGWRIVALIAFIAVLVIGIWGSIQVARQVPNAFSNLAAAMTGLTSVFVPANEESISLSAPSLTVSSGETFLLSWEHTNKGSDGSYTFRYNCTDGVVFTSPDSEGTQTTVYCNTPFHFLNANDAIILTSTSGERLADAELFIDFTPNGGTEPTVTGTAMLTIANENISGTEATAITPPPSTPVQSSAPAKGAETSTTYPIGSTGGTKASDPNGYVDLAGRIIEVGIVNKTTGEFTASSTPMRNPLGSRLAIRFAVENIGTKRSSQFDFNAVLPTIPSHIFSSPMQQELGPGDRIEFTLAFDSFVDADTGEFTLNIDPTSRINENKTNNILKYTIRVVR